MATSINDPVIQNLQLGPNPCSAELLIKIVGVLPDEVSVIDQLGRKVRALHGVGNEQLTIPVNDLADGLYYVQTISDGVRHSKKFVVRH